MIKLTFALLTLLTIAINVKAYGEEITPPENGIAFIIEANQDLDAINECMVCNGKPITIEGLVAEFNESNK